MIETEMESARKCINPIKELIENKTQDRVTNIFPINNERHFIFVTERGMRYQMIFKRNFFMSFGKIFNLKGIGESVNSEVVQYALDVDIHNFVFVYAEGKVYTIPVREFHDYAVSHNTIRKTVSNENTMSVPIGLLRSWK